MIAHIAGVPVEETVPALAPAIAAGLLMARAWLLARLRLRRTSADR